MGETEDAMRDLGVAGALRWLVEPVHPASFLTLKVLTLAPELGSRDLGRMATTSRMKVTH